VIGTGGGRWKGLCRFDGLNFLWQPVPLPKATIARAAAIESVVGEDQGDVGITSGTCRAWNDCWFFGTYATIVHWDGKQLTDASPSAGSPWLATEFTAAVLRASANSEVGIAVGSSATGSATFGHPLPAQPDGSAPPEVFTPTASGWSATT